MTPSMIAEMPISGIGTVASDWMDNEAVRPAGLPELRFDSMSMRQRPPLAASVTGAEHVPLMRKSAGFAPPSVMAEMVSGASPTLVTNTGWTMFTYAPMFEN